MKKFYKMLLPSVAMATFLVSSAYATDITFDSITKDSSNVLTTDQPNTVVWNFNDNLYPNIITNITSFNAQVVSGSTSGQWAAPGLTDRTPYLEVGAGGSFTVELNGTFTYLGLYWGSIDTYNTLTFYNNGSLVATYTGSNITDIEKASANGDQQSLPTNIYVNFNDLPEFNSFKLTSSSPAFEVDNIAIDPPASVPESATMLLFGTGLTALAGFVRRKRS